MDKLKVLIADDSIIYRRILSNVVESTGLGSVEVTASNGLIALEWIKQREIDVVLLDVFMPEMNGIDTLKAIKKDFPSVEVIMISGGGTNSASTTLDALKFGAMDFILKPAEENSEKSMKIIMNHIHVLFAQIKVKKYSSPSINFISKVNEAPVSATSAIVRPEIAKVAPKSFPGIIDVILIASSTGGPAALDTVFTGLLQDIDIPVLIVQHMPPDFTKVLAQSLDKKCKLNVVEGKEDTRVLPGQAIIAPGGLHMIVNAVSNSEKVIHLDETPYVNGVRPSADVLFRSVAKAYAGKNILAVVLTGMGNDGMNGILEIKKHCNCYCITQSESTCVVYGMPRSVYEAGLSDEVINLNEIPSRIQQIYSGRRK